MPWTKTSKRAKSKWAGATRRKGSLARAVARKAPRRYEWVAGLDSPCNVIVLPPHVCAPCETEVLESGVPVTVTAGVLDMGAPSAPVRFSLWDPQSQTAESQHIPSITEDFMIVRVDGHVTFVPYFVPQWTTDECEPELDVEPTSVQIRGGQPYDNYFLRAALVKDKWIAADRYFTGPGDQSTWTSPTRDPMNPAEWIDGRFARQWQKEWFQTARTGYDIQVASLDYVGVCSNTSGTISANSGGGGTLADGSGTIASVTGGGGSITTTCTPFQSTLTGYRGERHDFAAASQFKLSLNTRRKFRMQESEGLSLWVNYTARNLMYASGVSPSSGFRQAAVGFYAIPNFRMLVELP